MPTPRCTSDRKAGGRCKLKTKARHPYCWIHTKYKMGLEIKDSKVPGAGKGLFAAKDFKRKDKVVDITGDRHESGWGRAQPDSNHYIISTTSFDLDQNDPSTSSVSRYANQCRERDKPYNASTGTGCKDNNTKMANNNGRLSLKANTTIKKGREIFVRYGKGYWGDSKEIEAKERKDDDDDDDGLDRKHNDDDDDDDYDGGGRVRTAAQLRESVRGKEELVVARRQKKAHKRKQATANYPNSMRRKKGTVRRIRKMR